MGCDIHIWPEMRLSAEDDWTGVNLDNKVCLIGFLEGPQSGSPAAELEAQDWNERGSMRGSSRDYALFSLLAGVRGDENPMKSPQGWPPDAHIDQESMGPDLHSHTWYGLSELLGLWKKEGRKAYKDIARDAGQPDLITWCRELDKDFRGTGIELRFLIAFDN